MPTYEYKCPRCNATASVTTHINSTPKTPKCGACDKDMERQYGNVAVTFKGNGWGKDAK